ncbi:RTA1-domain-containing protein [Agrocybe pediades]|nr:RTA1-domain-containing protein [Agrocybe pediades]
MSGSHGPPPNRPPTALYGYIPTRGIAVLFLLLFIFSTGLHVGQAIKYRTHWLFYTAVLCGALEILGWAARLWSSYSPLAGIPFQIQITATIIAPTPLLAASFVIFGEIIKMLGPCYSRISAKWYTIIFSTCDVLALVIQGAGGGIAATAHELQGANKGGNIMLVGIVFQLIVILTYAGLAVEFLWRYQEQRPTSRAINGNAERGEMTHNVKQMLCGLAFSFIVFFIRSIYRMVELSDGWSGRIIRTQVYFNVLDGAMIVLAIYTINLFHPGRLAISATTKTEKDAKYMPGSGSSSETNLRMDYINV